MAATSEANSTYMIGTYGDMCRMIPALTSPAYLRVGVYVYRMAYTAYAL